MRRKKPVQPDKISSRKILPALLLCFFFGIFGTHRFYVGKYGTGILQMLTLGGLFFWVLIDLVIILTGHFCDEDGAPLKQWT